MDDPLSQVLRIDFSPKPEEKPEAPQPSQPKPPPAHLNGPARQAWADIVKAARCPEDADERAIELAAVLLARLREEGPAPFLAMRLNTVLIELGLPPGARAELQPQEALAAYARMRRAQDAADLVRYF